MYLDIGLWFAIITFVVWLIVPLVWVIGDVSLYYVKGGDLEEYEGPQFLEDLLTHFKLEDGSTIYCYIFSGLAATFAMMLLYPIILVVVGWIVLLNILRKVFKN